MTQFERLFTHILRRFLLFSSYTHNSALSWQLAQVGFPPLHLTFRVRQLLHATETLGLLLADCFGGGSWRCCLLRRGIATLAGRSASGGWEAPEVDENIQSSMYRQTHTVDRLGDCLGASLKYRKVRLILNKIGDDS